MAWITGLRLSALEKTLRSLDWLSVRRGRAQQLPAHLATGLTGEDVAFFYLRRKGYTVVARRWASGDVPGDVDLIAWQGSLLCFIEVKTRTARDATPAHAAVDEDKRRILRRLARRYLRQLPHPVAPQGRFDVISVYLLPGQKPQIEHFEGAFPWVESGFAGG
jgi:putative endonuclease